MYQAVLQQFGIKPVEISLYTLLLQLGPQPASIIAKKTELKRTTARVYLESLNKSGLVKFHWKDRTQYFRAENPEAALDQLRENKEKLIKKLENNLDAFQSIIPELKSFISEEAYIPKVTFYEGIDQLKRMYQDTLASQTEVLCLSSVEDLWDLFGEKYDNWYVKKRVQKKIPVRYIAKNTPKEKEERKKDKNFLRKSRLIAPGLFNISNEINIYDNKVSIITLKDEKIGILIDSKEISHTLKVIFEILWQAGS